jgi:quinol monooxygenase YgiN
MIIKKPAIVIDREPQSRTFHCVATFVPIARWRDVWSSFRLSNQVEAQIRRTPGIVAYSLAVNPLRRHFWTYSVWTDAAAIPAFTKSEPHTTAVERFKDWAGQGAAFVEWQSEEARLDWDQAFARLMQPSHYYEKSALSRGNLESRAFFLLPGSCFLLSDPRPQLLPSRNRSSE